MKSRLINTAREWSVGICLLLLLPGRNMAAQWIEVKADIEWTSWHSKDADGQAIEKRNSSMMRCVIGTNTWLIEHNLIKNGKETCWFTGSKLVRHRIVTKEIPPPERVPGAPVFGVPPIGQRTTDVFESSDGQSLGNVGVRLPWLAFCSGTYLKRDGRRIPLPVASGDKEAFDYSDRTVVFDDDFGLPKSVEFYTADGHLQCQYYAEQSTNVLGWTLPLQFQLVFYRPARDGTWERQGAALGKVTAIGKGAEPKIPPDI